MTTLRINTGPFTFGALLQHERTPKTCAAFLGLLPYRQKIIQARWSGESAWIPLGDFKLDCGFENEKSDPAPGELLFYPGGISETEILFPYGRARFACKDGVLAGNPFLVITEGRDQLPELGKLVLWHGAQDIVFRLP